MGCIARMSSPERSPIAPDASHMSSPERNPDQPDADRMSSLERNLDPPDAGRMSPVLGHLLPGMNRSGRSGEEDNKPSCLDTTNAFSHARIRRERQLGHLEGIHRTVFRCEERVVRG
jgi:hypothetical protein